MKSANGMSHLKALWGEGCSGIIFLISFTREWEWEAEKRH